jgi:hypothetical protein
VSNPLLLHAHRILFERYLALTQDDDAETSDSTSIANLRWMCEVSIENLETYPIDKLSRWLGYVQGCLTSRGLIDVQTERDFSRPLFHAAYADHPHGIPPTRERQT